MIVPQGIPCTDDSELIALLCRRWQLVRNRDGWWLVSRPIAGRPHDQRREILIVENWTVALCVERGFIHVRPFHADLDPMFQLID